MKTYIIEFQRAEQYDEACNCKPRSFAKAFDEITYFMALKSKMRKKLLLSLVIIAGVILTGCNLQYTQDERKPENETSMFIVVERTMTWNVVYNKETKVMYAVSSGSYNGGTFTMLCDKDGKPQLWEGNVNE